MGDNDNKMWNLAATDASSNVMKATPMFCRTATVLSTSASDLSLSASIE